MFAKGKIHSTENKPDLKVIYFSLRSTKQFEKHNILQRVSIYNMSRKCYVLPCVYTIRASPNQTNHPDPAKKKEPNLYLYTHLYRGDVSCTMWQCYHPLNYGILQWYRHCTLHSLLFFFLFFHGRCVLHYYCCFCSPAKITWNNIFCSLCFIR